MHRWSAHASLGEEYQRIREDGLSHNPSFAHHASEGDQSLAGEAATFRCQGSKPGCPAKVDAAHQLPGHAPLRLSQERADTYRQIVPSCSPTALHDVRGQAPRGLIQQDLDGLPAGVHHFLTVPSVWGSWQGWQDTRATRLTAGVQTGVAMPAGSLRSRPRCRHQALPSRCAGAGQRPRAFGSTG
jgi:hypothetical protein